MAINFEPSKSGLQAEQRRVDVSAHNVSNVNTDGFRKQVGTAQTRPSGGVDVRVDRAEVSKEGQQALEEAKGLVTQPENDVSVVDETVNQMTSKAAFQANAKALKAQDGMIGSLLDATG
jgi:flagellar basal-body rod protein FlgC